MIKKGDFVSLDYVGKVDGKIFDLTNEELAKKEGIYDKNKKYGSVTIVAGAGHLISGLDEAIIGKKEGDEFEVEVLPEKGFGKKNPNLVKIIPERAFKDQKLNPRAGMLISVDGILGRIVSISSGRAIVDFNHPLAGKVLHYKVKINRIVKNTKEKISGLIDIYTGLSNEDFEIEIDHKKAKIKLKKDINEKAKEMIKKDIKNYVKEIEEVKFEK